MTTPTEATNGAPAPAWRKPLIMVVILIALVVGALFGTKYWRYATSHASTDDANLTSDLVQISPQISGTVTQVLVNDNEPVKAGDLLVVLDDSTARAAVAQAQANLQMAIAQAQGAGVSVALTADTGSAQIMQAQGGVQQADSAISGARADLDRMTAAIANAEAGTKSARANVGTVLAAQKAANANIGTVLAAQKAANANVGAVQAGLKAAQANTQRAKAAVDGAQAQVATAQAGVRTAQANAEAARVAMENADRDAQRYADLHARGAVSAQVADHAANASRTAHAQYDAAQRQIEAAQSGVEARQADLASAKEQVEAAQATVTQAQSQVEAAQATADQAKSQLEAARANAAQTESQVEAARAQVGAAQAGVQQAAAQRNSTAQTIQAAIARRSQAQGQLAQAKTMPKQVNVSRSNSSLATARVAQAHAALDAAQIQLRYTHIYAPISGYVNQKSVQVGALVQAGTPLMALMPPGDTWITANYKETQLNNIRQGEQAEVHVDAFPGRTFKARVDSIAGGTGAVFALLPPDNATGNFTKVVQRIPVKLTFEPGQDGLENLRAGMSASVTISTKQ